MSNPLDDEVQRANTTPMYAQPVSYYIEQYKKMKPGSRLKFARLLADEIVARSLHTLSINDLYKLFHGIKKLDRDSQL